MGATGIGLVDVGLAELIGRADEAGRRRALAAGVELALRRTGLRDVRLDRAAEVLLAGYVGDCPERASVLALVRELDEEAWELQDRAVAGSELHERYLLAFSRARAAAAVAYGFEPDALTAASEGLYEAHHAIQDVPALRGAVSEATGRPS